MSKVVRMDVVCIRSVYEEGSGELWCPKGALYAAYKKVDEGCIYINNDGIHYIYTKDNIEMKSFYEEYFLEIVSKVV